MPKLFLTPFVIAGLLLLTSCSSSPKPADKPQVKSECDEVKEIYKGFSNALEKEPANSRNYRLYFLIKQYYLLEESKCFNSAQVAAAKAAIDVVRYGLNN